MLLMGKVMVELDEARIYLPVNIGVRLKTLIKSTNWFMYSNWFTCKTL